MGYWDDQLGDLLDFGFPLDFDRYLNLVFVEDNHKLDKDYEEHVKHYLQEELNHGLPSNIYKSFKFLSDLLHQLGLNINPKKLVEPSTSVVCLGILINTEDRTMSILL